MPHRGIAWRTGDIIPFTGVGDQFSEFFSATCYRIEALNRVGKMQNEIQDLTGILVSRERPNPKMLARKLLF